MALFGPPITELKLVDAPPQIPYMELRKRNPHKVARIHSSGYHNEQGLRPENEDAHNCFDDVPFENKNKNSVSSNSPIGFYGVYDGHAGRQAAEVTSKILHKEIMNKWHSSGNKVTLLENAFLDTDREILESYGWSDGTTVVTIIIDEGVLYCANAGDSEAFLCRSGKPYELSYIHKPTAKEEQSRISRNGGFVSGGRIQGNLSVSRGFGDRYFKYPYNKSMGGKGDWVSAEPSVWTELLNPDEDDFFIVACDGLREGVDPADSVLHAKRLKDQGKNPTEIAQALVAEALAKGSQDNVTVVVVFLEGEKVEPVELKISTEIFKNFEILPSDLAKYKHYVDSNESKEEDDHFGSIAIDITNQAFLLFQEIESKCTCPSMLSGNDREYFWDGNRIPATSHMKEMSHWLAGWVDMYFPKIDANFFPDDFLNTVVFQMLRRLFRVFSHIYLYHFEDLVAKDLQNHTRIHGAFFLLYYFWKIHFPTDVLEEETSPIAFLTKLIEKHLKEL